MAAATYNLSIDQGSDFILDLTVKEGGAVKNLTGYSARAQLRSKKSDATLAASFICTVKDPATSGQISIELPNSVSSALTAGRYFYDLEIYTANDNTVKRLIQGEAVLNQEVTR